MSKLSHSDDESMEAIERADAIREGNEDLLPENRPKHGDLPEEFKMIDCLQVDTVQIQVDSGGKIWVNVNGRCVFRSGKSNEVTFDTPWDNREIAFIKGIKSRDLEEKKP